MPEFDYYQVTVTRQATTEVYLKVPNGTDLARLQGRSLLADACEATVEEKDWDNFGWKGTIRAQSFVRVPEAVARPFKTFEVKLEQEVPCDKG